MPGDLILTFFKYTSENIKGSGWEQGNISSHSQCRKNSTDFDFTQTCTWPSANGNVLHDIMQ